VILLPLDDEIINVLIQLKVSSMKPELMLICFLILGGGNLLNISKREGGREGREKKE
jgi:hypothetical protein